VAWKTEGPVADAVGAHDDGAKCHPLQRREKESLGLMRQENRRARVLDTAQKRRTRYAFR
jgi:hypothetical protein